MMNRFSLEERIEIRKLVKKKEIPELDARKIVLDLRKKRNDCLKVYKRNLFDMEMYHDIKLSKREIENLIKDTNIKPSKKNKIKEELAKLRFIHDYKSDYYTLTGKLGRRTLRELIVRYDCDWYSIAGDLLYKIAANQLACINNGYIKINEIASTVNDVQRERFRCHPDFKKMNKECVPKNHHK